MNVDDVMDAVRTETKTERSRLGSSKSLYADTGGEMDAGPVRQAVATWFDAAAAVFEDWAEEEAAPAAELFGTVAETARDHADAVGDDGELGEAPAIVTFLEDRRGTADRVGASLGWAIVTDEKVGQAVGFFVGQADPTTAGDFRSIGDDLDAIRTDAEDTLADVVASADDENDVTERAHAGAVGAIDAAYDEYVERLEAQGVNPKPVC